MITESLEPGRSLEKADLGTRSEIHPPIIIIEARALIRECLAISLQRGLPYPVLIYPNLESWKNDGAESVGGVIILGKQNVRNNNDLSRIVKETCENAGEIPVIVFSDEQDAAQILNVLSYGAKGYIPSATPLELATEAIKLVMAGASFIPANVVMTEARDGGVSVTDCGYAATKFTGREDDVVQALLKGKSNKSIAQELNISENSVKVHIRSVMRKLGVRNRTEAVTKISGIIRESLSS